MSGPAATEALQEAGKRYHISLHWHEGKKTWAAWMVMGGSLGFKEADMVEEAMVNALTAASKGQAPVDR